MGTARKRAKLGDVIEVETPKGLAYLHFTSKDPEYGDTVRVFPRFFDSRPESVAEMIAGDDWFFAWYPVGVAIYQGMVTVVGNVPAPDGQAAPAVWRRTGFVTKEGKSSAWFICDSSGETLCRELNPEQRKLPIAAIWNHEYLVESLIEQWRPEHDV